jgi:hypothetical protein
MVGLFGSAEHQHRSGETSRHVDNGCDCPVVPVPNIEPAPVFRAHLLLPSSLFFRPDGDSLLGEAVKQEATSP